MDFAEIVQVLFSYNTRLVVVSSGLLGISSGVVGSFLLLRKRSLMGDALSHATLPGICLAFLIMQGLWGQGKALPGLLAGAALFGMIGFATVLVVRSLTRTKDDAAMGIVLSVFFGAGIALQGIVRQAGGDSAGLDGFIYGSAASMVSEDFWLLAGICLLTIVVALLLFKEIRLTSFDEAFAAAQGWPVRRLEFVILALVTAVTVVGLHAVGLILIIAFHILPPAAARFWTHRFSTMIVLAAILGALSGVIGALVSASVPKFPTGAVMVLTAAVIFLISLVAGPERGIIARMLRASKLRRKVARQHLLRALYEGLERQGLTSESSARAGVDREWLSHARHWGHTFPGELQRLWQEALIEDPTAASIRLTEAGQEAAARVTRNHRLWEIYLIEHADIAPSHVDRDADMVEHVLGAELVKQLETRLWERAPQSPAVPEDPHASTV